MYDLLDNILFLKKIGVKQRKHIRFQDKVYGFTIIALYYTG